jgi:hypothetical protein
MGLRRYFTVSPVPTRVRLRLPLLTRSCTYTADTEEDALLEDLVLDAIVDMCKQRIFSRIQSQRPGATYRKKGRAFLGSVIEQSLDAVRKHRNRKRFGSKVEAFMKSAVRLRDCLTRLETCQEKDVVARIKEVLSAAHRFNKTTDFDTIFQEFSPRDLNPSTQKGVEIRLGKLANYQECAMYLLRTAKHSSLFKKAEVKLVSLDGGLFTRDLTVSPNCHISGCLSRCDSGPSTAFGAKRIISRLMNLNTTNDTFLSTVQKILRESRVHAEVQIVCYYELHPAATSPRVICSSKDACYLCNLFIKLHGTFHIPKTHGNLYPGWRLLPIPALNRVQTQLNKALEARIRDVLGDIMTAENPSLMLSPNDNESTLLSTPREATSLIMAEAWGSGATEARRPAQKGIQQGKESTGACDPTSHDLSIPKESPPTNPESQPATPKLPRRKSSDSPGSRPPTPETCGELLRQTGPVGGPEELTRALSEHSSVAWKNGTLEQPGLENEFDLEQNVEAVFEWKPEQGSTLSLDVQSQRTSTPDHDQRPQFGPARSLKSVPELDEPTNNPEPRPNLAQPRLNPPPALNVEHGLLELNPTPEPNNAQDSSATRNPAPSPIPLSSPTPQTKPPRHLHLTRDQTLSLRLDTTTTTTPRTIPSITAGQITIFPELIRSLGGQSRSVVEVQVHWLPRRRAAAFYVARPRGFVDLERCDEGVEIDGGCSECVYVAYGGEVVVLDFVRG